MHIPGKKLFSVLAVSACLLFGAAVSASACTTLYVGADRTEEGTAFIARTEDYGANMNKLWLISEAGAFEEGSSYVGCPEYGPFEWVFTHDSYRFTCFTNDIYYDGVCPECGEGSEDDPVTHFSYTEFGTNEKGVSVSATETISGNTAIVGSWQDEDENGVDPYHDRDWAEENGLPAGIEETDIPTIILAEADTARDGVELLLDIYDTYGCADGAGLFILDQDETWYIENCSGTQYIAVLLSDDMIFEEPNMAVIGRIDLDDTDHVIASDRLIETAQEAGTFVGDAEENIIDFRASYASLESSVDDRLVEGLNYLNASYNYDSEQLAEDNTAFTISNLDEDDNIVSLYTNIDADRTLTKDDVFGFYHLSTVGKPSNQEIEIFQIFSDRETEYATVGWVGVGNMSYNVFVPCYPMLLDDVYEGYQVSTAEVTREEEKPDGFCTWTSTRNGDEYYIAYPDNWRDSYYFTFEGLGGYILYAEEIDGTAVSEEDKAYVQGQLDELQQAFYEDFASPDEVSSSDDPRAYATENSMSMAQQAHLLGLSMIDYLTGD